MELTLKDFTVTEKEKAGTDTDTPYKSDLYWEAGEGGYARKDTMAQGEEEERKREGKGGGRKGSREGRK